jgi:hypothetical protein
MVDLAAAVYAAAVLFMIVKMIVKMMYYKYSYNKIGVCHENDTNRRSKNLF